jgi:hypothetical protein
MFLIEVRPAHGSAGYSALTLSTQTSDRAPTAFERLPVNMTAAEIRAMVLDILG